MTTIRYEELEETIARAERLAGSGGERAIAEAIALARRVRDEAADARRELDPTPWDAAWARWSVVATRAALLLVRLGWSASEACDRPQSSARSGVRARASALEGGILVVEPDAALRRALRSEASAAEVALFAVATPADAARVRDHERIALVACAFPGDGAVSFVEALRLQRAPVVIVTGDAQRAVATFGLAIPVMPAPATLVALLERAHELAADPVASAVAVGGVIEIGPPPSRRDPRRE